MADPLDVRALLEGTTPGPWEWDCGGSIEGWWLSHKTEPVPVIAVSPGPDIRVVGSPHNLALIAAAPALAARVIELEAERDRFAVGLWRIRMEAERSSVNDPVWALPNAIIFTALGALGSYKHKAQTLTAAALRVTDQEGGQ